MLDLLKFNNFLKYVDVHPTAFYVEHNHFWTKGRNLEDELEALEEAGLIVDQEVSESCIESGNLWYVRYYPPNRNGYYEYYGPTFEDVMTSLMEAVEAFNEKNHN